MKQFFYKPKNFIYLASIIVFLMGFILHFLYDWTNESVIVGAFTPIDESIWEHTKLAFFPLIVIYGIYYLIMWKKVNINKEKWFTTMLINILVSVLLIPLLYYLVNSGFGVENKIVNISILLISLVLGGLVAGHFYKYGKGIGVVPIACITCFLVFLYVLLTYSKVDLPIFIDYSKK